MTTLSSSIFYILTGWTCVINIYKFFYQKKLNELNLNNVQQHDIQINEMESHYKKADKLGKIFLTLWCLSAVWFFYNLNA
tara:strand:- start:332 stop:571 length:240 start_codon:yes stop_codon:yes gene_type:complete